MSRQPPGRRQQPASRSAPRGRCSVIAPPHVCCRAAGTVHDQRRHTTHRFRTPGRSGTHDGRTLRLGYVRRLRCGRGTGLAGVGQTPQPPSRAASQYQPDKTVTPTVTRMPAAAVLAALARPQMRCERCGTDMRHQVRHDSATHRFRSWAARKPAAFLARHDHLRPHGPDFHRPRPSQRTRARVTLHKPTPLARRPAVGLQRASGRGGRRRLISRPCRTLPRQPKVLLAEVAGAQAVVAACRCRRIVDRVRSPRHSPRRREGQSGRTAAVFRLGAEEQKGTRCLPRSWNRCARHAHRVIIRAGSPARGGMVLDPVLPYGRVVGPRAGAPRAASPAGEEPMGLLVSGRFRVAIGRTQGR